MSKGLPLARRYAVVFLVLVALAWTAAPVEAEGTRRAYAFGDDKLTVIDEENFKSLGTITLPKSRLGFWWNNAEKDRLAMVVHQGVLGKFPSKLIVVDLEKNSLVNTVDLGNNAWSFNTSDDGNRAHILMRGGTAKAIDPTLLTVDTRSGEILARKLLDEFPTDYFFNDSGDGMIVVYGGLNAAKEKRRKPGSIELLDAETLESRVTYEFPGPVTGIYLDYPGRLYLLNRGMDRKSAKKQAAGEIYVMDRETLEFRATLDVGMAPSALSWDEEREVYYLLTAPRATKKDFEAQFLLIKGDEIEATLPLPQKPWAMQPSLDREHYYVLYKDYVVRADRELKNSEQILTVDKPPVQLFEHPDKNDFYFLHFNSPNVSIADGDKGSVVASVKSGRGSKKFGNFMAAVGVQTLAVGLAVAAGPTFVVGGTSYYYVPVVTTYPSIGQKTYAAFSHDARYLYVFNSATNDVTILDTESHEIVKKVIGGRSDFRTVHDNKYLCTVSPKAAWFYDIENEFAEVARYDAVYAEVLEIPGTTKAYLSRGLEKPVAVIDFTDLGNLQEIDGVVGSVVRPVDY